MSITLNRRLYIDEDIKPKSRKIKKRLSSGKIVADKTTRNIFCITLALNKDNLFDIMNVNELQFEYYQNIDINIVAIANGRSGAVKVLAHMVEEIYKDTGGLKVRDYFS